MSVARDTRATAGERPSVLVVLVVTPLFRQRVAYLPGRFADRPGTHLRVGCLGSSNPDQSNPASMSASVPRSRMAANARPSMVNIISSPRPVVVEKAAPSVAMSGAWSMPIR
jgi:hypothetical protein